MKTITAMMLCGLLLMACKPQQGDAGQPAEAKAQAGGITDFERASSRYLIDTKAVKTECGVLLAPEIIKAIQKAGGQMVCGKMTLGMGTTRQLIDIAHGSNQASPWEDGPFVSGIFAIADKVLMGVFLFPQEEAVIFQAQQ